MNILDTIVEHKRVEVLKRKQHRPVSSLNSSPFYGRKANVLDRSPLNNRPGIIAEFKRRSPSRGPINLKADPVHVAGAYREAGVFAMSILTDRHFFGGGLMDLERVRRSYPGMLLLRKDFIIDPYQVHESSAGGADMILLIAAILEPGEVSDLALEAASLGLHVLFEVHNRSELEKYHPAIELVGVNNRDLRSFEVDTAGSLELISHMPEGVIPVSESGLTGVDEIRGLFQSGFRLFLMGEVFMKEQDPGEACRKLTGQIWNDEA